MNRIFSPSGEGWPDFPRRSFGKLDQIEPIDPTNASQAVFCLDVVDADWAAFATGGRFDLSNPVALQASVSDYWNLLFKKIIPPLDPYDNAPDLSHRNHFQPRRPVVRRALDSGRGRMGPSRARRHRTVRGRRVRLSARGSGNRLSRADRKKHSRKRRPERGVLAQRLARRHRTAIEECVGGTTAAGIS